MITAVILTKNEEKNIIRCIKSLLWCDEIIVVDDYSKDGTVETIKKYESRNKNKQIIKIFQRKLDGDFAGQRNYGLEKAKSDWVLFADADETVLDKLAHEIITQIAKLKTETYNGYYLKRNDYFLNKWLKHGETANVKLLRLGRKGKGLWQGKAHERWCIRGKAGELHNPLEHYPHRNISQFLWKINLYTDIVAQSWKEQGKVVKFWEIAIYPIGKFVDNYLLKFGFMDGIPGLIIAVMMSFHSFLARSKYWLKKHE